MLSTNEVRARAARFADEWRLAKYEKGETQSFYNDFFNVFGVKRRQVARFEEPVRLLGKKRGFVDLFWKGVLLVEQKSAGKNLRSARTQAFDYFPGLKPAELPRYLLLSDFQNFELVDLDAGTETKFALRDLPSHVDAFDFIRGREKREYKDQDPVNVEASELMGELHDALEASGYTGHDLERFLVRLVFCLFADDTGIFDPRDIFYGLIETRTAGDGSDTGQWLAHLFEVLNMPEARRQKRLDEDLAVFPYVNGDLFAERLSMPSFDTNMRALLIKACQFDWAAISPAIFGALFQSVMKPAERRQKGAHYTSEKNIQKVIGPSFMDDLHAEFLSLTTRRDSSRRKALLAFQHRLSTLRLLDPACGCGNFLIVAYRELRRLETQVLKEIHRGNDQLYIDIAHLSQIDVDQFFGIEIEEFSARIAEIALWMMDHIMNNELSAAFGQAFARIPLKKAPRILNADALDIAWETVLPARECSYVIGNPPFAGAKYQTEEQRAQVRALAQLGGTGGTLDYVCAWFLRAGEYLSRGGARLAFVATNSITQGEQVAQLWPLLFERYAMEIDFAHRSFEWDSDARGKAHVHVVIVGMSRRGSERAPKRLFTYDDPRGNPTESAHAALSAYLLDASKLADKHLVVREINRSLAQVPKLISGSQPIDDGEYIFEDEEKQIFLKDTPRSKPYLRPYIGSDEFINGGARWILTPFLMSPSELRAIQPIRDRVAAVRKFRMKSGRKQTQKLADDPASFYVTIVPESSFLVIPKVSSERRDYVPMGWLNPPTIPSDLVFVAEGVSLWHFGILTSRMHMAWLRDIGGRLKSDYRYSIGIVYNTFPWPDATDKQTAEIEALAQAVLDARSKFPEASLADLYDSTGMKPQLRRAHQELDAAVDRLYARTKFEGDRQRVEHLLGLYEKLVASQSTLKAPVKVRERASKRNRQVG